MNPTLPRRHGSAPWGSWELESRHQDPVEAGGASLPVNVGLPTSPCTRKHHGLDSRASWGGPCLVVFSAARRRKTGGRSLPAASPPRRSASAARRSLHPWHTQARVGVLSSALQAQWGIPAVRCWSAKIPQMQSHPNSPTYSHAPRLQCFCCSSSSLAHVTLQRLLQYSHSLRWPSLARPLRPPLRATTASPALLTCCPNRVLHAGRLTLHPAFLQHKPARRLRRGTSPRPSQTFRDRLLPQTPVWTATRRLLCAPSCS